MAKNRKPIDNYNRKIYINTKYIRDPNACLVENTFMRIQFADTLTQQIRISSQHKLQIEENNNWFRPEWST